MRLFLIVFMLFFCVQPVHAAKRKPVRKTAVQPKKKKTYRPPVKQKNNKKKAPKKKTVHKRVAPKRNKNVRKAVSSVKKQLPRKKKSGNLVVLDPGHGGFDLGACSGNCVEKKLCLATAERVKKYLNDKGYRVIMTRTRDVFIPLEKRTKLANQVRSKIFVSLHYNAAKSSSASGIEVFYYNSKDPYRLRQSKKLATAVLGKMLARSGAISRGVKAGNFYVIRETSMPSILVEGGFITHARERGLISDARYREKLARAIADGIHTYFK